MRKARLLSLFTIAGLAITLICMIGIPGDQANGQTLPTLKTLHSFGGTVSGIPDGHSPNGSPVLSGTTLYGLTSGGGEIMDSGTIFSFDTATGIEKVLHSFGGATVSSISDGINPNGSLILLGTTLYGMTYGGGANGGLLGFRSYPSGTIFSFDTATSTETVLHSFGGTTVSGIPDGNSPYGSLTLIPGTTTLYGMTSAGGATNCGTIFMFDTATGVETVLYSFAGGTTDGSSPNGSLILSGTTLYGMTLGGGENNGGTIFTFDTATGVETILHNFGGTTDMGAPDGTGPYGSPILSGATLYGMTYAGGANNGGAIFSFDTNTDDYNVLHNFGEATDGANPRGSLTLSGTSLYGMTLGGGTKAGGTIFMLDTATGVETILHSFSGSDGSGPTGSLILSGTTLLYGATSSAGAGGGGTIFSMSDVVEATAPGAPTMRTAKAGNAQATVSFEPPASNGWSAITGYTVTSAPGGKTAKGSANARAITVTGLTNGTPYKFTVTAKNNIGTSPASSPSNSVTPATTPGAPTNLKATVVSNGQATVSFKAPASNGGSAILFYTVTTTNSHGDVVGTPEQTQSPSCTVTGLGSGTYKFSVTATNGVGTGASSSIKVEL